MTRDQVACSKTQAIKIQFMLFVQFLHSATMEKKGFEHAELKKQKNKYDKDNFEQKGACELWVLLPKEIPLDS